MVEKVIMFGGSGFLGKRLTSRIKDDYHVILATRSKNIKQDINNAEYVHYDENLESVLSIIDGSDIVVNFSGASIAGKRWNDEYKKVMYDSRINTTELITRAINKSTKKPHTLISTSATGTYSNRGSELLTEESKPGNDFLSNLCINWEKAALKSVEYGVRTVCIRVGVVLDEKEGAFIKMVQPFKYFVGGKLGNGSQYFPWIHINDIVNIYKEAVTNKSVSGIINGTAPNPVTNSEFSKTLGKVLHRPGIFAVPKFALKVLTGEFAEFLLASQRVIPEKLITSGFRFEFNNIEQAIKNVTNR